MNNVDSTPPRHKAGFRFSFTDACAIVVCSLVTWQLRDQDSLTRFAFPIALGHFFLFCNIFRVRRKLELIWATAFLINAAVWMSTSHFSWLNVLAIQSPLTFVLIAIEVRSPEYHGIGWQWINAENVKAWEERNP